MSESGSDVDIGVPVPPPVSVAEAAAVVADLWGLEGEVSRLPSERDQNFAVAADSGRYVLKVANPAEERAMLEAQNRVMARLAGSAPGLMQEAIPTRAGESLATVSIAGTPHLVRLLDYLPGRPMGDVAWHSPALLQSVGRAVGLIDGALAGFDDAAFHRRFYWDLEHAPAIVAESVELVDDAALRAQIGRFLEQFQRDVGPRLADLRSGLIHADANDYNLLVSADRVSGVLDLGDMVWSRLVYDPAIAAAYTMTGKHDPLEAVLEVAAGYHAVHPLTVAELAVLYPLACLRLCQSVCVAAVQQQRDPENRYLSLSQARIQPMLPRALEISPRLATYALRERCGLAAVEWGAAAAAWINEHAVAVVDPPRDGWQTVDQSPGSAAVASEGLAGRHNEARYFPPPDTPAATIHLGADLFVEAGAAVRAPLDAVVREATVADGRAVAVLAHPTPHGEVFTIYRGLAPQANLTPGLVVGRGDAFARTAGVLHVQLALDLLGLDVAFPVLIPAEQRAVWAAISPTRACSPVSNRGQLWPPIPASRPRCDAVASCSAPASRCRMTGRSRSSVGRAPT